MSSTSAIVADFSEEFTSEEIFDSKEDMIRWARDVGKRFDMVLTIRMSDSGIIKHQRPRVILICECGGKYRGKNKSCDTVELKRKRATGTKKCECPFQLKGTKLGMSDEKAGWELTVVCGWHNHADFKYMEGHSYAGRLNKDEVVVVSDMSKALAKPKDILLTLKQRDDKNASTMRTVYNARRKIKFKEQAGRSQMQLLLGKLAEHNYFEWHRKCEKTDEVLDMLWMHPESLSPLRSFPQVLIMDCTYKTNRYRRPLLEIVGVTSTDKTFLVASAYMAAEKADNYEWVLRKLYTTMEGCEMPKVIVTDRELGLMKAIALAFPMSRHMLCRWHISKNILTNCKKMFMEEDDWVNFANEWSLLVNCENEDAYDKKLSTIKEKFAQWPGELSYIAQTWLDPYKDRFISAWTDSCMHFGNYTSNRAESAHAKLKRQLGSSKGSFSDCWGQIDKLLFLQITEIKASFEKSKNVYQHGFTPADFKELRGFVSLTALGMIKDELFKANNVLSGTFSSVCQCKLRSSYGLPCMHELYTLKMEGKAIPLDSINMFWKTLSLDLVPTGGDSGTLTCEDDVKSFSNFFYSQDDQHKQMLLIKLRELHKPDITGLMEPSRKVVTKGRPSKKIDTSTRRDPSAFEYVTSLKDSCSPEVRKPYVTKKSLYINQIPEGFRPFISKINDVKSDGNCGFRVVALMIKAKEDSWPQVRVQMLHELRRNEDIYMKMFKSHKHIEELVNSLECYESPCSSDKYWMTFPEMGHLIASCYNIVLHFFSLQQCLTFLPVRSAPVRPELRNEAAMEFVNENHFVHVTLKSGCPVPPIAEHWMTHHHLEANCWETAYKDRIDRFRNL